MPKIKPIVYDYGVCRSSRANQPRQPFHNEYGLWIFRWRAEQRTKTYTKPKPRLFEFYNICHLISGKGWHWREGEKKLVLSPGDAILNAPGIVHDYNGYDEEFVEDFVCFGGPVADALMKSGIFSPGIVKFGQVRRLLPIIDLAQVPTKISQLKANMALQNLIVELFLENQETMRGRRNAIIDGLLRELQRSPEHWWTVSEMAERVSLSVNRFINLFKEEIGLTPKQYIDRYKIELAAEELLKPGKSIVATAKKFGYVDPFHFSKRFKRIKGLSPQEYKRKLLIP